MITVNLPLEEVKVLLGIRDEQTLDHLFYGRHVFKMNGLNVVIVNFREYTTKEGTCFGGRYKNLRMIDIDLEPIRLVANKEQLAAEEAVEKAKASLDAAQKVLESVKSV